MDWKVTTPPSVGITDYDALARMVKPAGNSDRTYLLELLAECTAYAEELMECSLVQRTITAKYWVYDLNDFPLAGVSPIPITSVYAYFPHRVRNKVVLPRGPVITVSSVKDNEGNNLNYIQEKTGNADELRITTISVNYPITIVYTAGYTSIGLIPADIKGAIKTHVATRYRFPEAVDRGTGSFAEVTNLDNFYRSRGRGKEVH